MPAGPRPPWRGHWACVWRVLGSMAICASRTAGWVTGVPRQRLTISTGRSPSTGPPADYCSPLPLDWPGWPGSSGTDRKELLAVEMRFQVIREAVEDVIDQCLVGEIARVGSQQLEPPGPLAIVREKAVHIGAGDP